jgi:hypothetical protein
MNLAWSRIVISSVLWDFSAEREKEESGEKKKGLAQIDSLNHDSTLCLRLHPPSPFESDSHQDS